MRMPLLLPSELNFCHQAVSDEDLYKQLITHPPDLILFLEIACADETWGEEHPVFMQTAIQWVHQQFFQDQLMIEFAHRLALVIRNHPAVAATYLPKNITIKLRDAEVSVNTLMYAASSNYLKDLIRLECRDRMSDNLKLPAISSDVFESVHEYIMKGYSESLYTKDKPTGEQILKLSQLWDLKELFEESQRALIKWISRENVIDVLLKSHHENWLILRHSCYEFINNLDLDVRFWESSEETLKFEFVRFSENSLGLFKLLRHAITHLVFEGDTVEQPEFKQVVNATPHLKGLDLSHTNSFGEFFYDIPKKLDELTLGSCAWLNEPNLNAIVKICPSLTSLNLISNSKLNYTCWPVLKKLPHLNFLDVSRHPRLLDDDLQLILESCGALINLNIEECRGITDVGFSKIVHLNPRLTSLNLSRTMISDLPLVDIVTFSPDLMYLNLTRCEKITEKGILDVIRSAKKLKHIVITNTEFTKDTSQQAKKIKPFLTIEN